MILHEITLCGFGSYKNKETSFIPEGLTGIVGCYDSNPQQSIGTGKSTLVAALNYAFFGEGEFDKLEELLNDDLSPKDEFYVKVVFSHQGSTFEVERGKGTDSYLNLKENGLPRGDPKIDSRTNEIKKIIGMDYDMFTASVFFEQDKLNKLIATDPTVRRGYVEKVLGTDLWTSAGKLVTTEKNSLKKEYEATLQNISKLSLLIQEYEAKVSILPIVEIELKKITKERVVAEKNVAEAKLVEDNKKLLEKKKQEKQRKEISIKEFETKIVYLNSCKKDNDSQIAVSQEYITSNTTKCEKLEQEIETLEVHQTDLELTIEPLEEVSKVLSIALTKVTTEKRLLLESKDKIEEGICPTCQQSVTKNYLDFKHQEIDLAIHSLTIQEEDITKKFVTAKDSISSTCKSLLSLKEQLATKKTDLTVITKDLSSHQSQLKILQNSIQSSDNMLKEYVELISSSKQEFSLLLEELVTLEKNVALLNSANLVELEYELNLIIQKDLELNQEIGKIQQIQLLLDEIQKDHNDKTQYLKDLDYQKSVLKIIEEEFDRIPSDILAISVVAIEKESSDIIHNFIPDMDIIVREDLTKATKPLQIYFTVKGKRRNYKRLSGGQRTIANLALRLGFSKVIACRTGVHIDFVILDEPFGYLDSYTRDLIKKVLTELSKWFRQILVISHVDNVQDFPNIIKIIMDRYNVSRIEQTGAK
jgi:DNA repair exonuclease SbcCD ATPase subunit